MEPIKATCIVFKRYACSGLLCFCSMGDYELSRTTSAWNWSGKRNDTMFQPLKKRLKKKKDVRWADSFKRINTGSSHSRSRRSQVADLKKTADNQAF